MEVSRRGFFGMLAAGAAASSVPELWVPTKKIFLPPAGGWGVTRWGATRIEVSATEIQMSLDDFANRILVPAMQRLTDRLLDGIYGFEADLIARTAAHDAHYETLTMRISAPNGEG